MVNPCLGQSPASQAIILKQNQKVSNLIAECYLCIKAREISNTEFDLLIGIFLKFYSIRDEGKLVTSLDRENSESFAFPIDQIVHGNCIEKMSSLPDSSVDLAIADPPYNLSKGGSWKWDNSVSLPGMGGDWNKVMQHWDNMPLLDYFQFTLAWLTELKRIVRATGSIWIHGTYHNMGIINMAMQILSVEIINEIIWYKRNSFPNLSGRRLTASHESILWAHTGTPKKRKYYFNYELSKEMPCPEDLLKKQGKQMRSVWDIPNNKKKHELLYGKHPTQKPLRLIERMLGISSKPGDICLIPFAGSGSECVAARKAGLHYLAFETHQEYIDIANKRLNAIPDTYDLFASLAE